MEIRTNIKLNLKPYVAQIFLIKAYLENFVGKVIALVAVLHIHIVRVWRFLVVI